MTIDERLERLAERHEALAQSVEILTHDVQELKSSVQELKSTVQGLVIIVQADHQSIVDLREASFALLKVVQDHERRITKLEGHPPAA
jgi:prefoldin subunit 5